MVDWALKSNYLSIYLSKLTFPIKENKRSSPKSCWSWPYLYRLHINIEQSTFPLKKKTFFHHSLWLYLSRLKIHIELPTFPLKKTNVPHQSLVGHSGRQLKQGLHSSGRNEVSLHFWPEDFDATTGLSSPRRLAGSRRQLC